MNLRSSIRLFLEELQKSFNLRMLGCDTKQNTRNSDNALVFANMDNIRALCDLKWIQTRGFGHIQTGFLIKAYNNLLKSNIISNSNILPAVSIAITIDW